MSPLISRLAIVAAGLPIVLGSAYLGGWFLFALVALMCIACAAFGAALNRVVFERA